MTKDELRQSMRERRRGVSADARRLVSAGISRELILRRDVSRILSERGTVCVYMATRREIDLSDFIAEARKRGCRVVIPRWNGSEYGLAECPVEPTPLVSGPMGIPEPPQEMAPCEPSAVGLWVVPGLAFASDGGRLGYGGGWYDRLLASADARAIVIGVGYDFQQVADLPTEPHDRKLSAVIFGKIHGEVKKA